jgi:hexosaminidase
MSMYSIDMSLLESNAGEVMFELSTAIPKANIRYTIDGSDPSVTSAIFPSQGVSLTKDAEVKANLFIEGKKVGNTFSQNILVNKLTNMTYARNYKESKYLGNSKNGLSDGITGTIDKLDNWVGLNGDRFEVVYDFPQKQKVNSLRTTFLHAPSSWIMLPKNIQVYGSKDGKIFKLLSQKTIAPELNPEDRTESVFLQFKPQKLKSLKVIAESFGLLPESHPGKGNPSWLFIDEIEVK